jgi:hypothetical protein
MKKILVFIILLVFASTCLAAGTPPSKVKIKTGDDSLDAFLKDVDINAAKPGGEKEIRERLNLHFSLSNKQIDFFRHHGYSWAEIYYLALLAGKSGKKIDDVAALHAKGVGWGQLAHKLNVHPGDLNKLRVQLHKEKKIQTKQQQTIKARIKVKSLNSGKKK